VPKYSDLDIMGFPEFPGLSFEANEIYQTGNKVQALQSIIQCSDSVEPLDVQCGHN
jgi:predicted ester cyclase